MKFGKRCFKSCAHDRPIDRRYLADLRIPRRDRTNLRDTFALVWSSIYCNDSCFFNRNALTSFGITLKIKKIKFVPIKINSLI